jgi:hypothetical protein
MYLVYLDSAVVARKFFSTKYADDHSPFFLPKTLDFDFPTRPKAFRPLLPILPT